MNELLEFIDLKHKKEAYPDELSGGQKQRLALARALLLDPPILLLDDPTAAVDSGTEREIADAMALAMQGRTTIIVAHRQIMLRRASLIFAMDRGRIIQSGTHETLNQQSGYYQTSLAIQNGETGGANV